MSRGTLTICGGLLLGAPAWAQHQLDAGRRIPITVPIKNAGTVSATTGVWTPAGASTTKAAPQNVFNNTCTWTVTNFYGAYSECEDSYDEGRIPSTTSPGAPAGVGNSQQILEIEIGYCTFNATPAGGMNMELAFWNKLNGNCIGGQPINHSNTSGGVGWTGFATEYLDTSGLNLPGSTTNGFQACWLVTIDTSGLGWTLTSDGDGVFDNLEAEDKFIWGKRINDQSPGGSASPNGFILSGDPNFSTPGDCTYAIPCQTDVWTGLPCGTGLGAWDGSFINVDNVASFGTLQTPPVLPPAPCLPGVAVYGYGTNCYWFGGYPTNVFDSQYLRVRGETGASSGPGTFCTSKPSSLPSCTPVLSGTATSVSKWSGSYTVTATPVPGGAGKPGILIWTRLGLLGTPVNTAFGFLCLAQFQRAGAFPASPGGTNGSCNGTYNWPLHSIVESFGTILVGDDLHIQGWYRDSGFPPPGNANFTNGIGPVAVTAGPPPTGSGITPNSGGEGTPVTVSGTNFGTVATDLKLLLAGGLGFADVSSAANTTLGGTVFKVGSTGTNAVTVIRGSGLALPSQNSNLGAVNSSSSLVRALVNGQGSNFGSFTLSPGSSNTVSVSSGVPLTSGITIDLTILAGDDLRYRLAFKLSPSGTYSVFEGRIDFTSTPSSTQRALHLADHLNLSFGTYGLSAGASGASVRVSMAGATYSGIVVGGI